MKKVFLGVIIVIVLAVIILGGVFAWQYFQAKQKSLCWPYCPGMTDQDRQKNKDSALDAQTADWKTYRNDQYGFEFKYPTNFVDELSGEAKKISYIFIRGRNSENLILVANYINDYNGNLFRPIRPELKFNMSTITVDNVKSYLISQSGCYASCTSKYGVLIPSAVGEDGYISIEIATGIDLPKGVDEITDKEKTLFNQIISTFKFTK